MHYTPGKTIFINGTVAEIKNEKDLTSHNLIEFILESTEPDAKARKHTYMLKAFTDKKVGTDKYHIRQFIGQEVTVEVYLNGKNSKTDRGIFHSNELIIKSIVAR